jgi:hypothetical protein
VEDNTIYTCTGDLGLTLTRESALSSHIRAVSPRNSEICSGMDHPWVGYLGRLPVGPALSTCESGILFIGM